MILVRLLLDFTNQNLMLTECILSDMFMLIHFFLPYSTTFKRSISNESVVWSGKFAHDIPCFPIKPLLPVVIGACTGPLGGLSRIQLCDESLQGEQASCSYN